MLRSRTRPRVWDTWTTTRRPRGREPSRVPSVIATAACALILAGCGSSSPSSSAGALPTPPDPSGTAQHRASRSGPRAGQCHLVSQRALRGAAFDASSAVPCSQPHNVEIASVRSVYGVAGLPDQETLQSYYGDCSPDMVNYLQVDPLPVSRVDLRPVPVRTTAGRIVVACDLMVAGRLDAVGLDFPMAVTSGSLEQQAAARDLAGWHLCARRLTAAFPLSDCTAPHGVEALFHLISLHLINDRYPAGGTDDNARGDALCRRALSTRSDAAALTVHSHWPSKSAWESEAKPPTLDGTCWFWRSDGKDLPPVH